MFAECYEAIGCPELAAELRRVVATFPFANPHLECDERVSYMVAHWDQETLEVVGWGDRLCGEAAVWERLSAYCQRQRAGLGI